MEASFSRRKGRGDVDFCRTPPRSLAELAQGILVPDVFARILPA